MMMFRHMRSITPTEQHPLYLCHTVNDESPLEQLDMAGSRVVGEPQISKYPQISRRVRDTLARLGIP